MSSLPTNILGPIAQSNVQQHSAARTLENEREQQHNAATAGARMSDRATDSIGEADNDTRVHTDSEGLGSQGRHAAEEHTEKQPDDAAQDQGIHRDDDGHLHVDLQA